MLRIDVSSGIRVYAIPPTIRSPATHPATRTAPARSPAPRSLRSASAIPGAGASTGAAGSSGSATSARTRSRRSTGRRSAATTAGAASRDAHEHRRQPAGTPGPLRSAGRPVRPQRRRHRDRRLRLPRHALRRARGPLHLRRLRLRHDLQYRRDRAGRAQMTDGFSSGLAISSFGEGIDGELLRRRLQRRQLCRIASSGRPGSRASREGGDERRRPAPPRPLPARSSRSSRSCARRGREDVVAEGVEPERGVNGDEANADGEVSASQDQVAGDAEQRFAEPCRVDRRPRDPCRHVGVVGQELRVVHMVHQARAWRRRRAGRRGP